MTGLGDLEDLCSPPEGGQIDLVVDLSNVCRDTELDQTGDAARWDRLTRLLRAWTTWPLGFEWPAVRLVGDESLAYHLRDGEERTLRQAVAENYAELWSNADDRILDLAEQHGCWVLTRDQFIGYRRSRPWLDGNRDQFVSWEVVGGSIRLEAVELRPRSSYSVSRAEEADELKALHLRPDSPPGERLLRDVYRCDNARCIRRMVAAEGTEFAPCEGVDGGALCPSCSTPLARVGPRPSTAIVKLSRYRGKEKSLRVPLTARSSITIGRSEATVSLRNLLSDPDRGRISRRHLRLRFDGHVVTAEEMGSLNGSLLERWDKESRTRATGVALEGGPVVLRPRDRLVAADVLVIERSGRRFPFDLRPVERSDGDSLGNTTST